MTDNTDPSAAARQGDPQAMYETGEASRKGAPEHPPNLPAALQWYFKAASKDHLPAQLALATLLLDDLSSIGVKRNPLQALRWLEKAAKAGEALAQFRLAKLLLEGDGVGQNIPEGLRWLQLATQAGQGDARFELCCRYALGKDVEKSNEKSHQLLIAGVREEHVPSLNHMAMLMQHCAGFERNETLAARIYEYTFFKLNSLDAADSLGVMYVKGIGVPVDHEMAMELFEYAIAAGKNESMYSLGLLRLSTPSVKDLVEAVKWGTLCLQHAPESNGAKLLEVLGGLCTPQELEEGRSHAAAWKRVPRGMTVARAGELRNPLAGAEFSFSPG